MHQPRSPTAYRQADPMCSQCWLHVNWADCVRGVHHLHRVRSNPLHSFPLPLSFSKPKLAQRLGGLHVHGRWAGCTRNTVGFHGRPSTKRSGVSNGWLRDHLIDTQNDSLSPWSSSYGHQFTVDARGRVALTLDDLHPAGPELTQTLAGVVASARS